jgi:hypothetical protein
MTVTEWFISLAPMLLALGAMIFVVRRSGIMQVRAHRRRVEELLERIAIAVERRGE